MSIKAWPQTIANKVTGLIKPSSLQEKLTLVMVVSGVLVLFAIPTLVFLPGALGGEDLFLSVEEQKHRANEEARLQAEKLALQEQAGAVTIEQQSTPLAGALSYEIGAGGSSRIGIDVSDHQGVIDWPAVKSNGIQFAMIRVGARGYSEGSMILDEQFEANIAGAKAAGIQVGVYFFSQAISDVEARAEAAFVLEQLEGMPLDYPVAYDFETVTDENGRANGVSTEQRARNANTFLDLIELAGYKTMIYGNGRDLSHFGSQVLADHDIWFAEYDVFAPNTQLDMAVWQFTSTGYIAGIGTRVDLNVHFNDSDPRQLPGNVVVHQE